MNLFCVRPLQGLGRDTDVGEALGFAFIKLCLKGEGRAPHRPTSTPGPLPQPLPVMALMKRCRSG